MTTLGTPPMMTAPLTVVGANGPGSFAPDGVASLFFDGVLPVIGAATFVSNFLPLSASLS